MCKTTNRQAQEPFPSFKHSPPLHWLQHQYARPPEVSPEAQINYRPISQTAAAAANATSTLQQNSSTLSNDSSFPGEHDFWQFMKKWYPSKWRGIKIYQDFFISNNFALHQYRRISMYEMIKRKEGEGRLSSIDLRTRTSPQVKTTFKPKYEVWV